FFFFQAEDGIRDKLVTGVQTCALPILNVARIAMLRAGLPVSTSALTINRFCSSGLQAIAFAAERIIAGFSHVIVAGGTESMSLRSEERRVGKEWRAGGRRCHERNKERA